MVNRFPETMSGLTTPPSSSAVDPPPRPRWWTQLYSLFFRRNKLTEEESRALSKPCLYGVLTFIVVVLVFQCFIHCFNKLIHCHVSFSVQSVSVSPSSSATWHVDFLVKNPSSTCLVAYGDDDVSAKVGSLNAAVLRTSHMHMLRGHESFSVDLVTSNQSDVVAAASPRVFELDMKLSGKKKRWVLRDEIGHFDIRCENVIIGHGNVKCHFSFNKLNECCDSYTKL